jgi:hypothetical protein
VSYSIDLNKNVKFTEKKNESLDDLLKSYNIVNDNKYLPSSVNKLSRADALKLINKLGEELPPEKVSLLDMRKFLDEKLREKILSKTPAPVPSSSSSSPSSSSSSSSSYQSGFRDFLIEKNLYNTKTGRPNKTLINGLPKKRMETFLNNINVEYPVNSKNEDLRKLLYSSIERIFISEDVEEKKSEEKPLRAGEGMRKFIKSKNKVKHSVKGVGNRIKLGEGELMAGNDNPMIKRQLKRDLLIAKENNLLPKERIRELVKKLL